MLIRQEKVISGRILFYQASKYPNSEFIGLDLNPSPLSITLPKNTRFIKGNLQSIPYEDEEFDFLKTGELQGEFTEVEYKHAIDEMIRYFQIYRLYSKYI
jgi:ubiquinone/menaquinone biosynthesis C-methylase UbiE